MNRPKRLAVFWAVLGVCVELLAAIHNWDWLACAGLVSLLGVVELTDEQRRALANRVREALAMARIPLVKAALHMHLHSAADVEKMLAGERKLDAWRLEMLPETFHQIFGLLTLRDRGLPDFARTAVKVEPWLRAHKRTA